MSVFKNMNRMSLSYQDLECRRNETTNQQLVGSSESRCY